LIWSR